MPTPQRLPIVNSDDGVWGDILRQYLKKEHYDDGTDNAVNGGHQHITITASSGAAGTAPITFAAGTNLSTPVSGAMEYDGTSYYLTPSSATRKKIAIYNDTSGATGDIYYRDSSGNFTRLAAGSNGNVLTLASGIPSWSTSIGNTSSLTLKDTNFTLQDDGDVTKQAQFQLSGITTGTTRVYTLPNASGTLLDTASAQTISGSKTFTSITYATQVWMTPTGGAGNSAAMTLDNSNGQVWQHTNNSGGVWALWDQTNSKAPLAVQANSPDQAFVINPSGVFTKSGLFTINDSTDATKQVRFDASGITTGTLRTYSMPNASTTLVGTDTVQTLTNKRVTPRVVSVTSSATPTINTDNGDHFNLTALAVAVTSMTTNLTGTPTDGQRFMLRIKDNGTARAITWGASFLSSGSAQLLTTTSVNMTHHLGFIWDAAKSAWICIAVDAVGY